MSTEIDLLTASVRKIKGIRDEQDKISKEIRDAKDKAGKSD